MTVDPKRPDLSWIEFDPSCRNQNPDVIKNMMGLTPPTKSTWLRVIRRLKLLTRHQERVD
jgi:hypothetical protein